MSQILYGKNPINELLRSGRRKIHTAFLLGIKGRAQDPELEALLRKSRIPIKLSERKQLDTLACGGNHQGVVCKVDDFPYIPFENLLTQFPEKAFFLVCDSIQDPQNLGSICRSACCFGVDAVILGKDRSADISPTVFRASAGAVEYLQVVKVTNLSRSLDELKKNGFWVYAAEPKAKNSLEKLGPAKKSVVVLGSEGEGLRPLVMKQCDLPFSIPMARSFDSLNVAQAASVILYEFYRKCKI